jgi:hypothetical protein
VTPEFQMIVPNDNIWKNVIVNQTTGVVQGRGGMEAKPPEATADEEGATATLPS